jgi:NAD+ synthase
MTDTLTIALAQLSQRVGDLPGNADAMLAARKAATGADLILFPELQLIGYPPEDLVMKPALAARAEGQIARLAEATADGGPAMLVGTIVKQDGALYNAMALLDGGKVAGLTLKHELPNYGTFDEKRLFAAGPLPKPFTFRGVKIGVPICEDVWLPDVCAALKAAGAELLLSPNGSPYEIDKDELRSSTVAAARVKETGLPMAYLNRVGGQDEVVFDGASFVLNGDGTMAHQMQDWEEESIRLTRWTRGKSGWTCEPGRHRRARTHPVGCLSRDGDRRCAIMLERVKGIEPSS